MGNMIDYVYTVSGRTFEEKPFCPEDALVFSQLIYLHLEGIIPEDPGYVTPGDLWRREDKDRLFAGTVDPENNRRLLLAMGESRRYGDMKIGNFLSVTDKEKCCQFAAAVFRCEGVTFVAFRGTDTTTVGWKEDFDMPCVDTLPSQQLALAYLEDVAPRIRGDFFMGGHSKGGNLSVYAALFCKKSICKRIYRVFSMDGPGFREGISQSPRYDCLAKKIIKIVPKYAYIGLLLHGKEPYRVVASDAPPINQHNPFHWKMDNGRFVYEKNAAYPALYFCSSLNKWIDGYGDEERRRVMHALWYLTTAGEENEYFPTSFGESVSLQQGRAAWRSLSKEDRLSLLSILTHLPGTALDLLFRK